MAMLVEAAGGAASTGLKRLLEIAPTQLHQRVPVILGAKDEVALIEGYFNQGKSTPNSAIDTVQGMSVHRTHPPTHQTLFETIFN